MNVDLLIGMALGAVALALAGWGASAALSAYLADRFAGATPPLMAWRIFNARQLETLLRETLPDSWPSLLTRRQTTALAGRIRQRHRAGIVQFETVEQIDEVARFLEQSELAAELPASTPVAAALANADVEHRILRARGSASYHPFTPPAGPVRFPAEHEAVRSVLLAWPTQYPVRWRPHAELAREIAARAEAHIVAPNAAWVRAISLFLQAAGARLDNIRYICAPNDDVWIRDYGPTLVQSAAGPVFIANPYVPNGLGFHKRDHELPVEIARIYGLPVHRLPLIIEGGNLISDGAGRVFLTDSVFSHNPDCDMRTLSDIMRRWFGAIDLTVLPALPQDVTGHADIALKLAGDGGAWVTQAPPGHPWRETLDEIAAIVAKTPTPRGDRYRVVRMPIAANPSGTSEYCYCNSLTVNGAILYPSYAANSDQGAAAMFQALAPNAALHGIDFRRFEVGGLHCQTKEVPAL